MQNHEIQNNDLDADIKQIRTGWRKWGKKEITAIALVIIFIIIFFAQNIAYIQQDGFKFTDFQVINAIDYYIYLFRNPQMTSTITYPPLTYLITMPHFYVMGISRETARYSLMIFWLIFLLSMFGIGYQYGGYFSGLVVMALSASSPHVLEYSRIYFLDFPQAATTALAFYLLLKTDRFRNRLWSILFGFGMTLTLMAKWSSLFFMIIPVLWFLLPLIFKSKKTIQAFLIFLLTFLISIAGTILFYKTILHQNTIHNLWYINFILSIIIPVGINYFMSRRMDGDFGTEEGYTDSPEQRIINFNFSSIPVIFFTGSWFSWAGKSIAQRYMMESQDIKEFDAVYRRMFEYATSVKTLFSFFVILLIVGLIFIIIRKRKDMVILILTSLVSFHLVFELATYDIDPTRYIFSIVIFLAPVCGFWVIYTGRAREYITAVIVTLSLLSILAWTLIPGESLLYFPVKFRLILPMENFPMKVLCTEPPDHTTIDFQEVLKNMAPDRMQKNQYSYYLISSKTLGHKNNMTIWERLNLDIFKYGKVMGPMKTEFYDYSDPTFFFMPDSLKELGITNVLLLSEGGSAPSYMIKQINSHFKFTDKIKKIHIGGKYWITLLRIENNFPESPSYQPEEKEGKTPPR